MLEDPFDRWASLAAVLVLTNLGISMKGTEEKIRKFYPGPANFVNI